MIRIYVDTIRYNFYVSRLILWVTLPLVQLGKLSAWLKKRVKVNGVSASYHGVRLNFPRDTGIGVLSRIYWSGERGFEEFTSRYMIAAFRKADLFFDVGSNFGFYSVLASKVNDQIFNYCFEPVDFLRSDNERFHKVNNVHRWSLLPMAVGDADGTAEILIPEQKHLRFLITSATLSQSFADQKGFRVTRREIPLTRLDTFYKSLQKKELAHAPRNIVIKIDVEGFELSVLKGALELVRATRPVIFVEIFLSRENIEGVNEWLRLRDYLLYLPLEVGLINIDLDEKYIGDRNFVLLPRTRLTKPFIPATHFEHVAFSF